MADDQRPYRSSDAVARSGQARTSPSGSDPLAELARLIGQNDPFGEYARENARAPVAQQPAAEWAQPLQQTPSYSPHGLPAEPHETEALYGAPAYGQQGFGYRADGSYAEGQVPDYLTQRGAAAGQGGHDDHVTYDPAQGPYHADEDGYYDDAPPSRRRMGILAIAGVFALAVLGTAGAFGYRAIFGSSGGGQPPVIKAETAPSKVVPASAGKDAASNKLITDRIGGAAPGQGEKLVSREEEPIEMRDKPAGVIFPASRDSQPAAGNVTALGSGVVGTEPKKIRTIAIHPDGADAGPAAMSAAVAEPPPRPAAPPVAEPPARPAPQRAVAPPPTPAAAPAGNAPLSLNPAAAAAPRAAAPARTASVPPAQSAPGVASGAYVQVSSQRSEADAQAAFRSLQGKYPDQLGGRQPAIHRVDLGAKGIYFRAMVGPLAGSQASELCASLKAAGGQCIIQRN